MATVVATEQLPAPPLSCGVVHKKVPVPTAPSQKLTVPVGTLVSVPLWGATLARNSTVLGTVTVVLSWGSEGTRVRWSPPPAGPWPRG